MRKYQILCDSMDRPNEWMFLGGSYHAMTYAATIYKDDHRCIQLFLQLLDFRKILAAVKGDKRYENSKRAFLTYQTMHQSDCIQSVNNLRKKSHMPKVPYPSVCVPPPSG